MHKEEMKMENCLFCKIIQGDIPSAKVYEDEYCFAFRDINPQAPTHILLVPKMHVANIGEACTLPAKVQTALFAAIEKIAAAEKLENGFRVVSNCGKDACQSVNHLHLHILGGKQMSESMS